MSIKIAIAGVGNCASSLIQGIQTPLLRGLMHPKLGGYGYDEIEVVFAIDIDARKVGKPLSQAIYAAPNCTVAFNPNVKNDIVVCMGFVEDGVAPHLSQYAEDKRIVVSDVPEPSFNDLVHGLKASGAEMLVNYMPVGSQKATERYAELALAAGVGFINCMPVFIASDDRWIERFRQAGLPLIGDDVKSQIGATIVHRELMRLFEQRGVVIKHSYQLNSGGNTDFLNMLDRSRLTSKRISKTESVQSNLDDPLPSADIHVGPSDYVEWQRDNKICFIRIEGEQFGGVPMTLDLRLSVEDSPNSAGVVIDAIRCMKIALGNHLAGNLADPSAYLMKHPKIQKEDFVAREELEDWIRRNSSICNSKIG